MMRVDADADYLTELLPALLVFSLGLSATVAPLTATVLADADEENAGIASGVNNAIARAAGLLGVAAIGAVIAAQFASQLNDRIDPATLSPASMAVVRVAEKRALVGADVSNLPPGEGAQVAAAVEAASVSAFHTGMGISAALVGLGGILGIVLVRTPSPPGAVRGLRGRPARRGAGRRGARAGAGRPPEPQVVLIRPPSMT